MARSSRVPRSPSSSFSGSRSSTSLFFFRSFRTWFTQKDLFPILPRFTHKSSFQILPRFTHKQQFPDPAPPSSSSAACEPGSHKNYYFRPRIKIVGSPRTCPGLHTNHQLKSCPGPHKKRYFQVQYLLLSQHPKLSGSHTNLIFRPGLLKRGRSLFQIDPAPIHTRSRLALSRDAPCRKTFLTEKLYSKNVCFMQFCRERPLVVTSPRMAP